MLPTPTSFDSIDDILCPHCGTPQLHIDEADPQLYDDGTTFTQTCSASDCGKQFAIQPWATWSWQTDTEVDNG